MDTVRAQDIEGIGSEPCEDAWIGSDAALVLGECGVSDIVIAVFDTPMTSDGVCGLLGRKLDGTDIQRDFGAALPKTGFGVFDECAAADPDHALKIGCPLSSGDGVADIEDLCLPVFVTITGEVLGQDPVNRHVCFRHRENAFKQFGLVLLQLNQKMTACLAGCFEGFFGSAWHPG